MPDWFVGGAGKRRLLRALLRRDRGRAPWNRDPPWSKALLAEAAGLHEKHTVFRHVAVLCEAGLLVEEAGGYRFNPDSPLARPLRRLIDALDSLPETELPQSRGR